MGLLQEAQLGRLGSRFSLNFRPKEKAVYLSPMGRFYDLPVSVGIGVRLPGGTYILPFADFEGVHSFVRVEQDFLLNGLEFTVRDENLALEFTCRIHAPFYPEDRQLSTAPFFYVDLTIRSFIHGRSSFAPIKGEWFFSLSGAQIVGSDSLALSTVSQLDKNCWYNTGERPQHARSPFSEQSFMGEVKVCPLATNSGWKVVSESQQTHLSQPFTLASSQQVLSETLIISGFQPDVVLKAWEKDCQFLYTSYFANIDAVIDYARANRGALLKRTCLFADTVNRSSIGEAEKSLIACGFQNYLANSWWVQDENAEDWFFIWEGWCGFHSTLDVEYNNSWFALLYWPELLEKQLVAWYRNLQSEGFPSHDVGILLEVNSQVYPHHMPVEEACNLVLLTYALWRLRGSDTWVHYQPELHRVVTYLLDSDTTGNGYPDKGVTNTVDDGAATVQYAREQTYLAVKVLSALAAISDLAEKADEIGILSNLSERSETMMSRIKDTMETKAWLGDHYAVCLPQEPEGLRDVWTGRPILESDLAGWDAYSLYTSNGLLLLLAAGVKPDLDYRRIKLDLQNALEKNLTPNGCTHSSVDRSNVWLSQNVWRDQIAGYLGIDLFGMTERYWRFLQWENTQGRGGCYVDTYGWNWLSYYPRGITAFGILAGMAGMRIDAQKQTVDLTPVRIPCRIPLLTLSNWTEGVVPWVECSIDKGEVCWQVEGALPGGWRINTHFGKDITGEDNRSIA